MILRSIPACQFYPFTFNWCNWGFYAIFATVFYSNYKL
jgi:hypothetical protein